MKNNFDILIIGGGVAGMTAAVYAKRRGKNVAILEKFALGGQVLSLSRIENFPSQSEIDGLSLCQMFSKQVKDLQIDVIYDDIVKTELNKEIKEVVGKKATYSAKSIIIATGLSYVELGVNEAEYLGKGVSYCVVCDANFYKNQPVCIVSKGGSGIKGALELANLCSHVTLIDSEDLSIYASANKNEKIEILSNTTINRLEGEENLNKITISSNKNENKTIDTNALFIELGKKPYTDIFDDIKKDKQGFIVTDENMQTSINGVYAVGDVRSKTLKQIVTACSDGAIAGNLA